MAETLEQHEAYLAAMRAKGRWTPEETAAHQRHMAARSWAEKDRQEKAAAKRRRRTA